VYERDEINVILDLETSLAELRLYGLGGNHEAVLVGVFLAIRLGASTFPGLEVAIDSHRQDHRVTGYAVKFAQHRQTILRFADVVHQAHREDAIDAVVG